MRSSPSAILTELAEKAGSPALAEIPVTVALASTPSWGSEIRATSAGLILAATAIAEGAGGPGINCVF